MTLLRWTISQSRVVKLVGQQQQKEQHQEHLIITNWSRSVIGFSFNWDAPWPESWLGSWLGRLSGRTSDGRVSWRDMCGSSMGIGAEQKVRPWVTRSREREERERTEDRASGDATVPLRCSSRTQRLPAHLRDYHVEMHKGILLNFELQSVIRFSKWIHRINWNWL